MKRLVRSCREQRVGESPDMCRRVVMVCCEDEGVEDEAGVCDVAAIVVDDITKDEV